MGTETFDGDEATQAAFPREQIVHKLRDADAILNARQERPA